MVKFPLEKMVEVPKEVFLKIRNKSKEDYNFVPICAPNVYSLNPKEELSKKVPEDAEIVVNCHPHCYPHPKDTEDVLMDYYGTALVPKK
jgi:hypothetical protein